MMVILTLVLLGCGPDHVVGTYHYYDEYNRQVRSFTHVLACYPELRKNPFISNVITYQHDDHSIQAHAAENASGKEYYAVILPNLNGFDCHDDINSGKLSAHEYRRFCDSLKIDRLLQTDD